MTEKAKQDRHTAAARCTLVSVATNFTLSTAQIIIGFFAHSQSLIADGFHTLTDLIADFVVLGANKISRKRADADHPYGHARFETVASMVLGLLLIIAGLGMLFVAIRKFIDPSSIPQAHQIALYAALTAIVTKELLYRYMIRAARRIHSTMLAANAWHARADAASSIVVAIGITGNLMGYPFFDPLAAALVGFLICRTGGKFAWDALSQLTDKGLPPSQLHAIEKTLTGTPGVINVHDLRTRFMGDSVLVDTHILVDSHLTVSEAHLIAVNARHRVLSEHQALDVLVHVDPEEDDDDEDDQSFLDLPERGAIIAALGDVYTRLQPGVHMHYLHGQFDLILAFEEGQLDHDDNCEMVMNKITQLKQQYPMLRSARLVKTVDRIRFDE